MRLINASLLIILTLVSDSLFFDLKCKEIENFDYIGCSVFDLEITRPNESITSVNGNIDPAASNNYTTLAIVNQTVNFLPKNIATFFPNVKRLHIRNSSLEWIEQSNLRELKRLKYLWLDNNNLEILEKGLFDFNTELVSISFEKNRLKLVHKDIFYGLSKLQYIFSRWNPCIDYGSGQAHDDMDTVVEALNSNCQSWNDVLRNYVQTFNENINNLQLENEKSKRQLKKFNRNLSDLQLENEKLRHQLKTCDGNLDAALTNFHQQKTINSNMLLMDKPNDSPPLIDLLCENEKCVARNFKVPCTNLSIETEFNKTEIIRSLAIHQQQTLFLPQDLARHFPQLSNLSVTESGLYEIGYSVFEGLNLFTLNLTSNKIFEMPGNTFTDMSNLQVLDLSFNKIHSLSDGVFAPLKSLQQLYLNDNYLTSIKVEVVKSMASLRQRRIIICPFRDIAHGAEKMLALEKSFIPFPAPKIHEMK